MKKNIDGQIEEIVTEEEHGQCCKCKQLIEISKKDDSKLIIFYKKCLRCNRFIEGKVIDLAKEYY